MEAICVTPDSQANDQLLYFTSSSLTADDRHLVFISDRTGDPNLFVRDLATGQEGQLTFNREGYLKSYVYFDGREGQGFGKASVSMHAASGRIYYLQGRQICCVDLAGKQRVLAEYPADQVTAFTHVSQDGSRLCVPTTEARALEADRLVNGRPPYNIDQRVQEENLSSYLRVYDTASGAEILAEPVPRAWITHVQFCPADNDLILYNHEWPADCGIRRMWLWDGERHLRLRPEGAGRSRHDWVCHEMWERDGGTIIYHGGYHNGPYFVGRVKVDGSGMVEISFPPAYRKYGHFTVSNRGLLVSDGYYQADEAGEGRAGEWISIQTVDWAQGQLDWTPLCKHGSNWDSQDSHPHPIFNHRSDAVFFTSNHEGRRAIYRVGVPDWG